jgi:hypothetical protein
MMTMCYIYSPTSNDLPHELHPKYSGPFQVVSQLGNDVT